MAKPMRPSMAGLWAWSLFKGDFRSSRSLSPSDPVRKSRDVRGISLPNWEESYVRT